MYVWGMNLRLFHQIGSGGEDSAAVRQFLVENGLADLVEFNNVAYEGPQNEVKHLVGHVEAPVLVANGRVLRGRLAIVDWLKTNILSLRD